MIVIAIYHMSSKVVSRGGRPAPPLLLLPILAAVACIMITMVSSMIIPGNRDLFFRTVLLPPKASPEWKDREQLWNAVERAEKTKDSRLAREFVVALPIELPRKAQISLLRDFIQNNFVDIGMCADFAIHDTDGHNPHAHILLTVRPLETDGNLAV